MAAPRFLRTCAVHHKTWYATKRLAETAMQNLPGPDADVMSAYPCDAAGEEELWHFGTDRERKSAKAGAELVYRSATPVDPAPLTFQPDLSHVQLNGHTSEPESQAFAEPGMASSIESLLAIAEASDSVVAKDLAKQIRALLVRLIDEIRYGEQERLLTERAAALQLELEETLRQIERLRGEPDPELPQVEAAQRPRVERRGGNFGAKEDQGAIRAWGLANGWDVKPIGQVSRALREAYELAMGGAS